MSPAESVSFAGDFLFSDRPLSRGEARCGVCRLKPAETVGYFALFFRESCLTFCAPALLRRGVSVTD